jgi:hypothetical protein
VSSVPNSERSTMPRLAYSGMIRPSMSSPPDRPPVEQRVPGGDRLLEARGVLTDEDLGEPLQKRRDR